MNLDAEGSADVLADDPHLLLLKAKMQRSDVLHHVRSLRALVDGQSCFRGIPVGDDGTRLQRHAGVPAEDEVCFHNLVGLGESLIDLASIVKALESQIVAEGGMND